jgi:hypothetical protein
VNAAPSITITGIGDHHRPEWPITFTGIRNNRFILVAHRAGLDPPWMEQVP